MSLKDKYFINKKDAQLAYNFRRLFTRTFILVVLFFIALFFINYNQKREISSYQLVVHTRDVILQSERTMSLVKDYETGARGFTLTNKDEFLESTAYSKDHLDKEVKNLQDLVKDNPAQVKTVDSFALLIQKKVAISDSNIRLRREQGLDSALAFVAKGYGKRCMDTIRYLESAIQKRENSLLVERKGANEKLVVFNRVIFGLTLLVFLIILVFLFWQTWYNVTEYNNRQKEVHALLRQLSHSLGSAQKLAHIGSWERNIDQDDEKWSDEIFRIFGYDPNTTQPGYQLFLNAIHPLDRLMVEQKINEATQNRMSYQLEYKIIRPNGETRHVRGLTEIYLGNDGKVVKLAGTIQDITDQVLKDKEKDHLAKMLQYTNETARIGWWEMDVLSKQVKWSKMVKEIYEVPEDFVPLPGINSRFIKDEASFEAIQTAVMDALLDGKSYSVELNIVTAKNNPIRVRAIGHPEFEDGVCVRLLGVLQDISSHQKQ